MPQLSDLFVCWTTFPNKEQALELVNSAVEEQLAACAQVESPIVSVYRWQSEIEQEEEFRVAFYAVEAKLSQLEQFIHDRHPYDTPKWVCLKAEKVSEKYLKWANEVSNLRGFS